MSESTEHADAIVKEHMYWAMGLGLLPLPVVDVLTVGAVQLKMLSRLAALYEVPFSKKLGKSVLAALLGAYVPATLAFGAVGSAFKSLPGIGPLAGGLTMPVLCGASTYAVGRVFTQHFATGGTLFDFDPEKIREFFAEQFESGKKIAKAKTTEAHE